MEGFLAFEKDYDCSKKYSVRFFKDFILINQLIYSNDLFGQA